MKIIIRTDASIQIGSGHVMRCLTVAKKLRDKGCYVQFWMEPLEGNLIEFVKAEKFENITEAQVSDLYIIDHYEIGIEREKSIRAYTKKIVVIDDLAREHDCDLLIDQNIVPNYGTRYDGLVPSHCIKLLGPKYLLMRDEFIEARKQISKRNSTVERLLVFMGGTDPTNETIKILKALQEVFFSYVDVVVGNSNPLKREIEVICDKRGYHFHCQINYMAQLMQQADFSIGAGGSTLWERCYIGLPSSVTIVADNQISSTEFATRLGVVKNLGWHEQVTVETYIELLKNLNAEDMSKKGLELTENEMPNAWVYEILELIK